MYKSLLKPLFDITFSLLGFFLAIPILLIASLLITLSNKGNPFFLQKRPGRKGIVFTIIKFKTMNDKKDSDGNLLSDEQRLTTIGSFIRRTSIDEIPQLINVLKGDMSLIGPRPLLVNYMHLYSNFQNRRHEVKPGITGWAQVNGRNAIDWETKFNMDVWYVDNISFITDIKILLKTLKKVILREGINSENSKTIEPFDGKY
jgi:undecaprenyl phosphate N,N'-diacetylbacillosamine 1-phosphate transferase